VRPLKKEHTIRHLPTLLVLDSDGMEVDRIVDLQEYGQGYIDFLLKTYKGEGTLHQVRADYQADPDNLVLAYKLFNKHVSRGDLDGVMVMGRIILDHTDEAKSITLENKRGITTKTMYDDVYFNVRGILNRSGKEAVLIYFSRFQEVKFSLGAYGLMARRYAQAGPSEEADAFFVRTERDYPKSTTLKKYRDAYQSKSL